MKKWGTNHSQAMDLKVKSTLSKADLAKMNSHVESCKRKGQKSFRATRRQMTVPAQAKKRTTWRETPGVRLKIAKEG